MNSIVRTLFGGSNASQSSQSTSTPTDVQDPAYQALRPDLANFLKSYLSTGGPEYQGPLNAPIGANEQTQLDTLMGQTGPNTQRQGVISDTLAGKFLPGQQGSNPFLESAIQAAQRPTFQGLEETLSRALPGRFTAAGQFTQPQGSSAFDRAAAIASRGAADAAADIATKMSYAGYEGERSRQQEAVTLDRQEVDSTVQNLQAQALPRLIQELGIERGLAEFQRRTTALLQVLQTIGGVSAPVIGNTQQSSSQGTATANKGIFNPIGITSGGSTVGATGG